MSVLKEALIFLPKSFNYLSITTWTGFISNDRLSHVYFHSQLHLMMGVLKLKKVAETNENELVALLNLFSYWLEKEFFTSFSLQSECTIYHVRTNLTKHLLNNFTCYIYNNLNTAKMQNLFYFVNQTMIFISELIP